MFVGSHDVWTPANRAEGHGCEAAATLKSSYQRCPRSRAAEERQRNDEGTHGRYGIENPSRRVIMFNLPLGRSRRCVTAALASIGLTVLPELRALGQPVWHGPDGVVGVGSTEPPGVARGGVHGIDLVLTGPNGHLYWQWPSSTGVYTNPVDLNDVGATSGPAMVAGGRNKLDAFY